MPLSFTKHSRKPSTASLSTSSISAPFSISTDYCSPISNCRTSSSSSSSSSALSCTSHRRSRTLLLDFNPLSSHPVYIAPPRLHDRPFLFTPSTPRHPSSTISVRSVQHLTVVHAVQAVQAVQEDPQDSEQGMDAANASLVEEYYSDVIIPQDTVRSRWSFSTIASQDPADAQESDNESIFSRDADSDAESDVSALSSPAVTNFSWKRETAPLQTAAADTSALMVHESMRRGGWKRCGVIFEKAVGAEVRFLERNSAPV